MRAAYLADVAAGEPGGERLEREALVLAGELVGGVDLHVASCAQRRLVGAAHHRGRRAFARVALDLHGRSTTHSPSLDQLAAATLCCLTHDT